MTFKDKIAIIAIWHCNHLVSWNAVFTLFLFTNNAIQTFHLIQPSLKSKSANILEMGTRVNKMCRNIYVTKILLRTI